MAVHDSQHKENIQDSELPPPKKKGWLYIFIAIGMLGVTALVLTTIYREMPRRAAISKRSNVALTRGVYALALSPVDSVSARIYTEKIAQNIGSDSAATKMFISGTYIARQFVSFSEFRQSLFEAIVNARPASIRTQGVLTAGIANSIVSDQLPSTLYIIGELGTENFADVEQRLGDAISALQIRNQTIGPLAIVSYPPLDISEKRMEILTMFLNAFRERGLDVRNEDTTAAVQ